MNASGGTVTRGLVADEYVLTLALKRGRIGGPQLEAARARAKGNSPQGALEELIALGVLSARDVAGLLAEEFGLELAPDLSAVRTPAEALQLVPHPLAVRYRVVPLARSDGRLRVAIADPLDTEALDELAQRTRHAVEPVVATAAEIDAAIMRLYGPEPASIDELLEALTDESSAAEPVPSAGDAAAPVQTDADAPIIKLVHQIILDAIQRRASDIHLEPLEKRFRVRYRIDGVLIEVENPPKRLQLPMISRVKIMANISIAEKRLPQDGRIQIAMHGRQLDLRVSSLPTAHGESIVMRILDKEGLQLGLPELGFFRDDAETFERLITLPDGILLVTGPTGSGKTTTLYGCLHHINKPDRKIITVEDPVEYQLNGINQVPVRHDVGMTFASALRAMLRQAPNIIMVGEIRDLETAEIAINASLTGHMVFSTLHTNDAIGAVTRMIDLGIKPFLVSTSLRGVMAQRLVRRVCGACKQRYEPQPSELRALNLQGTNAAEAQFVRGAGCAECSGTGYRGRLGIFEILTVDDQIQRMIYENAGTARLREKARSLGMRTMREDGARKVTAGLTTFEEVVSITVGDAS